MHDFSTYLHQHHSRQESQYFMSFVLIVHVKTSFNRGVLPDLFGRVESELINGHLVIHQDTFFETNLRIGDLGT